MTNDLMYVMVHVGCEVRGIPGVNWLEVTFGDCVLRLWTAKDAPDRLGLYVYTPDVLNVVGVDDFMKNR